MSCVEGIDQTQSGRLLHGMLASVNEYYSRNLSDEIKRKILQKVKNGGTPFLAPIGYLNKQDLTGGRDDRWIELDPDRAPLIRWAFEAYATGLWSLNSLLAELTARGLTSRSTAKKPGKALNLSVLERILVRPYFMGIVEFRGVQYQGSHPPLVTPEVFFKVQEVLAAHNTAGERSWRHQHYLKGSIFCDVCDSRMTLDFATGNGGRYCYFVCLGRKCGISCNLKAQQTEAVEQALERHWRTVRLPDGRKDLIRDVLAEDLADERAEAETDRRVQQRRIQKLKDERQKLLDGYYAGAIPLDQLKSEQDRIGRGLASAEDRLSKLVTKFDRIEEVITRAMAWVDQLHLAYQAATEQVRRLLNQALYTHIFIDQNRVTRGGLHRRLRLAAGIGRGGGARCCRGWGSNRGRRGHGCRGRRGQALPEVRSTTTANAQAGRPGRITGVLLPTVGTSSVWWRWRESNPRPSVSQRDFSERSQWRISGPPSSLASARSPSRLRCPGRSADAAAQ